MSHLLRATVPEQWRMERLCLNDEDPVACDLGRIRAALGREGGCLTLGQGQSTAGNFVSNI